MKIKSIFELTNKKIFYTSIVVLMMYHLCLFNSFLKDTHGLNFNIYDYLIYIFNDLNFVFWGIFLTTIVALYKIIDTTPLKKYLIMKFSNKKVWILNNILYIITFDFLLTLFIIIISILQLINKTSFINNWSEYGLHKYENTNLINYSPLNLTFKSLLSVFMYIFIIGLLMILLSLYFKKVSFVTIVTFFFNSFGITIFLRKVQKLYFISIVHNTLLIHQTNLYPYIYWFLLITIFIVLSLYRIKKIDF